ncbi:zinc-ribbon domain-containing protein [Yersinia enterocolitica]
MFCSECGKEISNTDKFCNSCGKEQVISPAEDKGINVAVNKNWPQL